MVHLARAFALYAEGRVLESQLLENQVETIPQPNTKQQVWTSWDLVDELNQMSLVTVGVAHLLPSLLNSHEWMA